MECNFESVVQTFRDIPLLDLTHEPFLLTTTLKIIILTEQSVESFDLGLGSLLKNTMSVDSVWPKFQGIV